MRTSVDIIEDRAAPARGRDAVATETRNALRYVLRKRGVHRERWGRTRELPVDPFSSECDDLRRLVVEPTCWLLQTGWTRAGPAD